MWKEYLMSKQNWKIPRYKVLRNIIAQDIAVGKYPAGSLLPSTRELCSVYNVSHNTVELAIRLLAEEKLIRCRKGTLAKVLPPRQKNNLWIAIIGSNPDGDILYNYQESPWFWTICNEITSRLLRDGNVALQLSLYGKWQEHLSKADGFIVIKSNAVADKLRNLPENSLPQDLPCVYIDPRAVPIAENTVKLDYSAACRKIATYFIASGVQHFLVHDIIDEFDEGGETCCRFQEFYRTLAENSVPADCIHKLHCEKGVIGNDELMEIIHKRMPEFSGKVGILCSQDIIAARICKAAPAWNRTLKKDLLVAGVSGLPELYSATPALSSINVPFDEIVDTSLNMLYAMINKKLPAMPGKVYNLNFCIRDT